METLTETLRQEKYDLTCTKNNFLSTSIQPPWPWMAKANNLPRKKYGLKPQNHKNHICFFFHSINGELLCVGVSHKSSIKYIESCGCDLKKHETNQRGMSYLPRLCTHCKYSCRYSHLTFAEEMKPWSAKADIWSLWFLGIQYQLIILY